MFIAGIQTKQYLEHRHRGQSTRPVWGATCKCNVRVSYVAEISIHAPRVGRDMELMIWVA